MENKFKVGGSVRLNSKIETYKYGKGDVKYSEIGKITAVFENEVRVKFPSHSYWQGLEEELLSVDFEVGDKVKIRGDVTLDEIKANDFNGCLSDTMNFLKIQGYDDFNNIFEIRKISSMGNLIINDKREFINSVIFEIVEKHKEEPKEMTVEEISKALGYEVKVVKG